MYSKIKNIQIIVSLLKQHGIRHLVLSAGTRHVPIAHSVENDPFFHCHSVVDERSAGYYAIGLAKELNEPVAIACTSSTATCNYTPAVAEAFYQKVPLLILTGDRDERLLGQLEDQMIDQVDMYRNFCKKCVNLPVVRDEMDEWQCTRLVNEAILELSHHGTGPVQINFQINQTLEEIADASAAKLPEYNMIRRVDAESGIAVWQEKARQLAGYKRIMVLCGSSSPIPPAQQEAMSAFAARYNCAIVTEYLSNTECEGAINAYRAAESINGMGLRTVVAPDLVIFMGGNFVGRWKTLVRDQHDICASWAITPDGQVVDPFRNLNHVFECSPAFFFRTLAELAPDGQNDRKLLGDLTRLQEAAGLPTMPELIAKTNHYAAEDGQPLRIPEDRLSAFGAMQALAGQLPEDALLHLSILNSTRIMQLFPLAKGISVYSNIGTDGIDGSMSTFLGQAAAKPDRPCYLVIGDLSFFYDMNAAGMRDIGSNVHILLINNGGGAEFYLSMGPVRLPQIDRHIAASHQHQAREWVEANGFRYMTADTQSSFDAQVAAFAAAEGPVVFEVFTDKLSDVSLYKAYRRSIQHQEGVQKLAGKVTSLPLVKQMLDTPSGKKFKEVLKTTLVRMP